MYKVRSEIDKSESHNPILKVQVFQVLDDGTERDTRSYNMSLQYVDKDHQEWCQQVVVRNMTDLVSQVEAGAKRELRDHIASLMKLIGLAQ